jgi:glycosyltransferase involved in cell wall biosynthesis
MGLHAKNAQVCLLSGVRDELSSWDVPFEKQACIKRSWSCVKQQAMRFKADVVHFQWVDNPFSVLRLVRWLQRHGIKTVYTPHNLLPHEKRWMLMPLYRLLYRAMDRVVARDQHIAWALQELLDVDSDCVEFIAGSPNLLALNTDRSDESHSLDLVKQHNEKRLLFFGHGSGRKGLDRLLDVVQQHQWPEHYHLVLAGEGVMSSSSCEQINRAMEKIKITVINQYVPAQKVAQLFTSADLLLMPYTGQCKSPMLDLAAALKLPVLKSDRVNGADFREQMHGVTFELNDDQQMLGLLQDDAWINASKNYLQSQVSTQQMMTKLADQHLNMYSQLLQSPISGIERLKLQQQGSGIGI